MSKEIYPLKRAKESVAGRVAVEATGPVKSFLLYTAHKLSRGHLWPGLSTYFGPEFKNDPPNVALEEVNGMLQSIDETLSGDRNVPEHFIGKQHHQEWLAIKLAIESQLGTQEHVSEYVVFDAKAHRQHLFILRGDNHIVPITIQPGHFDADTLRQQVAHTPAVAINGRHTDTDIERSTHKELAIHTFMKRSAIDPGQGQLRKMSSITNDFSCRRHIIFEREGEMFTQLRQMGGWSIGECQDLHRVLFSRGIQYDPQSATVAIDRDLAESWVQVRALSLGDDKEYTGKHARSEIEQFAREKLFFDMMLQYFKEHPDGIGTFLRSPIYRHFAMPFTDKNLSSLGLTETERAANMLANYYLLAFEGIAADTSPSQAYLRHIPHFHEAIEEFIAMHRAAMPPIPNVQRSTRSEDQTRELGELFRRLKKSTYPFTQTRILPTEHKTVIENAQKCIFSLTHQIRRNEFNQKALHKLKHLPSIIPCQRGIFTTVIANFGLAKVPGEGKFTVSSWLPHADHYLPPGDPLDPIPMVETNLSTSEVSRIIKYIFNGDASGAGGKTAYTLQAERIVEVAPWVFDYLQNNEAVPDNVKTFMQTLCTTDLATRILERFGDISKNDPLIVNRFFPYGFNEFQKSAMHRYIFDFIRGVETNIILRTSPSRREKNSRRFGGKWKNYNFSTMDEEMIKDAITQTLQDASHRIDRLNHERGVKKETLKDWQEFFEKMFGWNTFDMWFLRHEKFWDVWHTLGGAWDCICFSRKSISNPHVFQTW